MLWVDYLVIAIVLVSAIIGLFRGFLREIISVVVLVVAFWASFQFAHWISDNWLVGVVKTPTLRLGAAYVGIFVVIMLVGAIINFLVGRLMSSSGLVGTDRVIGMGFGVVRGLVVVILLILLAALTPAPQDPWWKASPSIQLLEPYAIWVKGLLPPDTAKNFDFSGQPTKRE